MLRRVRVHAEKRAQRHSRHLLEALPVRLHRTRRLVEEDPFDAEERDEHRDQVEVGLLVAGDLVDPVLERIEVDAAHRHAGGGERTQHAEEFLFRIDEIEDDQRGGREAFDHDFSLSSISTPLPAAGWRKATRQPCAPGTGASLMSRYPSDLRCARCGSMESTRKQMWWIPSPRFSMNFATVDSGPAGSSSSRFASPADKNAVRTPCVVTVST